MLENLPPLDIIENSDGSMTIGLDPAWMRALRIREGSRLVWRVGDDKISVRVRTHWYRLRSGEYETLLERPYGD
jgi:hypothetical protein